MSAWNFRESDLLRWSALLVALGRLSLLGNSGSAMARSVLSRSGWTPASVCLEIQGVRWPSKRSQYLQTQTHIFASALVFHRPPANEGVGKKQRNAPSLLRCERTLVLLEALPHSLNFQRACLFQRRKKREPSYVRTGRSYSLINFHSIK